MADICCQLAGNFPIGDIDGCIISINIGSSTEMFDICNTAVLGPTIGTLNISAYAARALFTGCPSKAGVSIPWIRKFDCDDNYVYFIGGGYGQSYISGSTEVDGTILASIIRSSGRSYKQINASVTSGPGTIYMSIGRTDGFGLIYSGAPWSFNTSNESSVVFEDFLGIGAGLLYLQSFDLDLTPGEPPVANYSFQFFIQDGGNT